MESKKINVSIIIVNYNTKVLTKNCIDSVIKKTKNLQYEIILVDNNSKDGSIDYFDNYKNIKFIKSKTNLGFGKANNLGYKYSSGEYIFFLNSDTVLLNNAVSIFYDFAKNDNSNTSFYGSILLDEFKKATHSYGDFPSLICDLKFEFGLYLNRLPFFKKLFYSNSNQNVYCEYVDYITGANLFCKKSLLEKHGVFDPKYFMYFEETDLQKRYNLLGYKSRIIKKPKIIHFEGGSKIDSPDLKKSIMMLNSKLTYHRSWSNRLYFKVYLIVFLIIRFPFFIFAKYSFLEKKQYFNVIFKNLR